ncbi:MAG: hypothetical protein OEV59_05330 [Deltaproteobacteria bacterium]|nr:hypothetical protein [Deltaproteobacteria bacterium]
MQKKIKTKCSYCNRKFPNKYAFGGHIKSCTAKKNAFERNRKIIDSLRPPNDNAPILQQENRTLPFMILRGWKNIANFLNIHPQTAIRWHKKSLKKFRRTKRLSDKMPISKFGTVEISTHCLNAWQKGLLEEYYDTFNEIIRLNREIFDLLGKSHHKNISENLLTLTDQSKALWGHLEEMNSSHNKNLTSRTTHIMSNNDKASTQKPPKKH